MLIMLFTYIFLLLRLCVSVYTRVNKGVVLLTYHHLRLNYTKDEKEECVRGVYSSNKKRHEAQLDNFFHASSNDTSSTIQNVQFFYILFEIV